MGRPRRDGTGGGAPSITSVAERAGVSIATVSRIVNGVANKARPDTVARVQRAIAELGDDRRAHAFPEIRLVAKGVLRDGCPQQDDAVEEVQVTGLQVGNIAGLAVDPGRAEKLAQSGIQHLAKRAFAGSGCGMFVLQTV